jgi:hypothetical protein
MTRFRFIAFAVGAAAVAAGAPARAQAQVPVVETTARQPPRLWEAAIGVRTVFIKDPAFDPFSNNDAFEQFSLSASRTIVRRDRAAFVAGLILDVGETDAIARDAPSKLSLTRLSALAEGRYQPWSRLYGFVRVAPGFLHGSASLDDQSSPASSLLSTTFNAFSIDASAGAAVRFGALGAGRLGLWLVGDGGYGWAQSEHLRLAPSLGADQSKAGAVDLGSLAASGGFFRVALALVY